jgi:tetratricopeptide (TPR) repeat protein
VTGGVAEPSRRTPQPAPVQNVTAVNGWAYGAIGADVHVFADEGPVYILTEYVSAVEPDTETLLAQPSRMLDAHLAIVGFTGRDEDLRALHDWRDGASRSAACWLHAPGGQGKTRLAEHFTRQSIAEGWKVVTAVQGRGTILPPPGSQDLTVVDAAGLLLIVDYADRWPLSHLTWLFSNALFHRAGVPTRMLLLARSVYPWQAVRSVLDDQQSDTSDHHLLPLPADAAARERMFTVARDSFATRYGIADPTVIAPADPTALAEDPDYGLTLTVLMAALVAVDAYAGGTRAPSTAAGLSAYLLDRERQRWTRLYENRLQGLDFQTPPRTMGRTVFVAALTGPVDHATGRGVIAQLGLEPSPQRILDDHAACYPPHDLARTAVLEPLYPDRLAEDLLALALPGHTIPAYQADPWSIDATATILRPGADNSDPPSFVPRGVVFLVAAAQRWPHVADTLLYPLLRATPELAVAAGGAALTAIAQLPDVAMDVLERIEPLLPLNGPVDLDLGAAALATTLAEHRLAATDDPAERGRLHADLGARLFKAGLYAGARSATAQAAGVYHTLSEEQPEHLPDYAESLINFGVALTAAGDLDDALMPTEQAVLIYARLLKIEPAETPAAVPRGMRRLLRRPGRSSRKQEPESEFGALSTAELDARGKLVSDLGSAIMANATLLSKLGRTQEAVDSLGLARMIYTTAAASPHGDVFAPELAEFHQKLSLILAANGQREEALAAAKEAAALYHGLAADKPGAYMAGLAVSLNNLGSMLFEVGLREEALVAAQEAVDIYYDLASANPLAHASDYAMSLFNLSSRLCGLGQWDDAIASAGQSVEVLRELAAVTGTEQLPNLSEALNTLALALFSAGHHNEALTTAEQAVAASRELTAIRPSPYASNLAKVLNSFGAMHLFLGHPQEALAPLREAVEIFQELAATRPARFLPELGQSLANLSSVHAQTGHLAEALTVSEQAVLTYRQLIDSEAGTDAHLPGLAYALTMYARQRVTAGIALNEALSAAEEACQILLPRARHLPDTFIGPLVLAYQAAADILDGLGRHGEAAEIRRHTSAPSSSAASRMRPTAGSA